jgi:hypothetical protein
MKMIAIILLLSFSLAQILPAIGNLCNKEIISMLSSDAEKNTEKSNSDPDEFSKKLAEFTLENFGKTPSIFLCTINIHYSSEKLPHPILDTQSPPPNCG